MDYQGMILSTGPDCLQPEGPPQRELAKLADLSDTYMSQLERGLHEPSIRVLRAIADSLGVKASQLLGVVKSYVESNES